MLLQKHIDAYRLGILEAKRKALRCIRDAHDAAKSIHCSGCEYCTRILSDETILKKTSDQLLFHVTHLEVGTISTIPFSKSMTHDTTFYRGFITREGKYLNLWNYDHALYRLEYIRTHGNNHAYSMIKIHPNAKVTEVHFLDYRNTPTEEQYETLKQLMIDAEGYLSFAFIYDTNHPYLSLKSA